MYIQLALALLQISLAFVSWAKQSQALEAGQDEAVAKAAASVLAETKAGKAILDKVAAMSDTDVDKGLKDLEP